MGRAACLRTIPSAALLPSLQSGRGRAGRMPPEHSGVPGGSPVQDRWAAGAATAGQNPSTNYSNRGMTGWPRPPHPAPARRLVPRARMDEPAPSRLRPASNRGLTSPDLVTALLTAPTATRRTASQHPRQEPRTSRRHSERRITHHRGQPQDRHSRTSARKAIIRIHTVDRGLGNGDTGPGIGAVLSRFGQARTCCPLVK